MQFVLTCDVLITFCYDIIYLFFLSILKKKSIPLYILDLLCLGHFDHYLFKIKMNLCS